jgi:hypothetical protein
VDSTGDTAPSIVAALFRVVLTAIALLGNAYG